MITLVRFERWRAFFLLRGASLDGPGLRVRIGARRTVRTVRFPDLPVLLRIARRETVIARDYGNGVHVRLEAFVRRRRFSSTFRFRSHEVQLARI